MPRSSLPVLWQIFYTGAATRFVGPGNDWNAILARVESHPDEVKYEDDLYHRRFLHCLLKPDVHPPEELLIEVIQAHPEALAVPDWMGQLSLHKVVRKCLSVDVLKCVLDTYPKAAAYRDRGGALPLHLVSCYRDDGVDYVRMLVEAYSDASVMTNLNGWCLWNHVNDRWIYTEGWSNSQKEKAFEIWKVLLHARFTTRHRRDNHLTFSPLYTVLQDEHGSSFQSPYLRSKILKEFVDGATFRPNPYDTCLSLAIKYTDLSWGEGLKNIYEAFPGAAIVAGKNNFYPFQSAATDPTCDLDSVFILFKAWVGKYKLCGSSLVSTEDVSKIVEKLNRRVFGLMIENAYLKKENAYLKEIYQGKLCTC